MLLSFSFGFMRSFAIWALLIVAACGEVPAPEPMMDANVDPPDTSDGIKSGTRLKVRWADFDGIKSFVSLFDTTRNEACMPRKFADGKTYCIPPAANVVFRDQDCTMPIGVQPRACSALQTLYYVENDPLTCDNLPKKIYSRGASISQPMIHQLINGVCRPSLVINSDLFLLGVEIPLTNLVALEEEPVSSSPGRMQQRFYASTDGARIFSSTYDTELAAEASMAQDASRGGAIGLPVAVGVGSLFGDASCTQRRIASKRGCPVPKYVRNTLRSCPAGGSTFEVLKVGAQASPSSLFTVNNLGTCGMENPDVTLNYFEVGTQAQTLGTFTRSPTTEGTGRFRKIYYSDGTSKILDPSLFDTLRQTECAPTTMKDGSLRCMPINTYSMSPYFTDSNCTSPIQVVEVPNTANPGCTLPPLPKYSTAFTSATCDRDVRALGQPIVGTLYTNQSGTCQAFTPATSTHYSVLPTSVEDFTAATISNE